MFFLFSDDHDKSYYVTHTLYALVVSLTHTYIYIYYIISVVVYMYI